MNHACAFGAADEVNAFSAHFEGGGGLGARVRGANGEGEFGEGTRGGALDAGNHGESAENFFERERDADYAGGTDENFLGIAVEAFGGFGDGALRGGVACRAGGAVGVTGVDDDRAHAAFRGAKMF